MTARRWHGVRQRLLYPAWMRIPEPAPSAVTPEDVERALAAARVPEPQGDAGGDPGEDALADAAVSLWRAQRRLDRDDVENSQLHRQLRNRVSGAWTGLEAFGLTVAVHDGEPFHDGLGLVVAAKEPTPGVRREQVIETVQPTVLRDGRVIRPGEVIVGLPMTDTTGAGT